MELGNIPMTTDIALETEVEELRNQIRLLQEFISKILRVLQTKFPEAFFEEKQDSASSIH